MSVSVCASQAVCLLREDVVVLTIWCVLDEQSQMDMDKGSKNLLVFDFGGGTLDVTIMEIESGSMNFKVTYYMCMCVCICVHTVMCIHTHILTYIQVRATDGDARLGGEDIDTVHMHTYTHFYMHTGACH